MTPNELAILIKSTGLVSDVAVEEAVPRAALRCARCGISSVTMGIQLDDCGTCNECRRYDQYRNRLLSYFQKPHDLERFFAGRPTAPHGKYDCLVLYSGGKDSTYVLYKLIEMGLRVITFTFDNGFISAQAISNVKCITEELGVKAVIASHREMKAVFRESLARYSTVCKGCFKGLLDLSLAFADENDISVIVTGLSRGQIVEERLKFFYDRDILDADTIDGKLQEGRQAYHAMERFSGLDGRRFVAGGAVDRIALVDYFRYDDVTKAEIYATLKSRNRRWVQPTDTGFCSSNCMINDVGVSVHQQERGYSNYEIPTAWEVRLGHLDVNDALQELCDIPKSKRIEQVLHEISYVPRPRNVGLIAHCVPQPGLSIETIDRALRSILPAGACIPTLVEGGETQTAKAALPAGAPLAPRICRMIECPSGSLWSMRRFKTAFPLDRRVFTQALLQVMLRHDALRLRIGRREEQWWCSFPMPESLPLHFIDLAGEPVPKREALVERMAARLIQKAMGSAEEAITHFAVLSPDESGTATVIAAAHDAALDDFSWATLLGDISILYQAIERGERATLPTPRRKEHKMDAAGLMMGAPRGSVLTSQAVLPTRHGPAERVLDVVVESLTADIGPDGTRWAVGDPGRRTALGGINWSLVGAYAQALPREAVQSTPTDRSFPFCAVILPREAPTGRSALFPDGVSFEAPRVAGQSSWLVLRDMQDGVMATWSDVASNRGDQALGRVMREMKRIR